jgi:hypothetical protein
MACELDIIPFCTLTNFFKPHSIPGSWPLAASYVTAAVPHLPVIAFTIYLITGLSTQCAPVY